LSEKAGVTEDLMWDNKHEEISAFNGCRNIRHGNDVVGETNAREIPYGQLDQ
jgi:hypothetical protein